MGPGLARPRLHKTTYAPMIYTAPCVKFLIWADRLHGELGGGGGGGAGNREFPCEITRADRRVLLGVHKIIGAVNIVNI
jgi:hypothetical protein